MQTEPRLERDDRPPPKAIGTATLPPESGRPKSPDPEPSRFSWFWTLVVLATALAIWYIYR